MGIADVFAAGDWAMKAGLISFLAVNHQHGRKLGKLLDPEAVDNLGHQLAPSLDGPR